MRLRLLIISSVLQVVTGSEDAYDVPGMAELLFGKVTVANSYAAHRLLNEDRTYFKQVNRGPPRFQPRSETEIRSIQAKAAADAKVQSRLPTAHIFALACTMPINCVNIDRKPFMLIHGAPVEFVDWLQMVSG